MTPELLRKYAEPVSRYTSYPTAPHFHRGVDAARASAWLEALPAASRLSLYFHIPFCRSLCWFCGCRTKITSRAAPIERYLEKGYPPIRLRRRSPARGAPLHAHRGRLLRRLFRPTEQPRHAQAV